MSKKKLNPNITVNIYEGQFDINFDCPGAVRCAHALCYVMPPEEDSKCAHCDHGTCECTFARITAVESVQRKIAKELKRWREEMENE